MEEENFDPKEVLNNLFSNIQQDKPTNPLTPDETELVHQILFENLSSLANNIDPDRLSVVLTMKELLQ